MWFRTAKDRHIEFLQAQVAQLQNYILMNGTSQPLQQNWSPDIAKRVVEDAGIVWEGAPIKDVRTEAQRMYTTELEEDIEFALQEGIIGEEEAARRMAEADSIADDIEAY